MTDAMKVFLATILLASVCFIGGIVLAANVMAEETTAEANEPAILEKVYETNNGVIKCYDSCIWRDTRTGVNYLVTDNGGTCVMVDAEGKPLVDRGE